MPDYNPAVALGVQPPQNDLPNTLGTISRLQEQQAQTQLYTLQGLQQERRYNALRQMGDYYNRTGDATGAAKVGIGLGLEPEMATQMATFGATQRGISAAHGMLPAAQEQLAGAAAQSARAANERAQLGGNLAETDIKIKNGAAQTANAFIANPNPQTRQDMINYAAKYKGPDAARELSQLTDQQLLDRATGHVGGGLTAEQGAATVQTQNAEGAPVYQTRAQFVGSPGVVGQTPQAKSQAEKQGTYFSNLYSGIAAAGNTAANAKDEINIAKSVINDPQFYSGTGEGVNLAYKRALASFGVDPGASLPQEAFRKVMAQNILNQVTALREAQEQIGGAGSRIFQSQIQLMENAAQNPDNSVAANRFLTSLAERSANRSQLIANMAADYRGGKLDAGFEKQLRDYTNNNPLFSDQELKFPKLIGMDPKERQYLKEHPNTAPMFDRHYGKGASQSVIGQ